DVENALEGGVRPELDPGRHGDLPETRNDAARQAHVRLTARAQAEGDAHAAVFEAEAGRSTGVAVDHERSVPSARGIGEGTVARALTGVERDQARRGRRRGPTRVSPHHR